MRYMIPYPYHNNNPSLVRLVATASYTPSHIADNIPLAAKFGMTQEVLLNKIGIVERAKKRSDETVADMCCSAYQSLRDRHDIELSSIGVVCVVTQNPDQTIPHTAAMVHEKLGLPNHCMTFDISQGCAGFVHGMMAIAALMDRLSFTDALLFTCDPYSKIVDVEDKNTSLIFGDAATVSYFSTRKAGFIITDANFGTVSGTANCLRCTGHLEMDGRAIVMNGLREVPRSVELLLNKNGISGQDIDIFLLHPGSKFMVDSLREKLGLNETNAPFLAKNVGNTVSSSIPMMLELYMHDDAPRRILVSGFGVGFSWGTALLDYHKPAKEM